MQQFFRYLYDEVRVNKSLNWPTSRRKRVDFCWHCVLLFLLDQFKLEEKLVNCQNFREFLFQQILLISLSRKCTTKSNIQREDHYVITFVAQAFLRNFEYRFLVQVLLHLETNISQVQLFFYKFASTMCRRKSIKSLPVPQWWHCFVIGFSFFGMINQVLWNSGSKWRSKEQRIILFAEG